MTHSWRKIFQGLLRDPLSAMGMLVLAIAVVIALLGAYLRPDATKHANDQHLALARQGPGFEVDFLSIPKENTGESELGFLFGGLNLDAERYYFDSLANDHQDLILFWQHRETRRLSLDLFAERDVEASASYPILREQLQEYIVNQRYLLGTDSFGRDMLSRLMGGTIVSLSVGLVSVLISLLIGISLGAIAGYYGGWVDRMVMWLINVIWSIPTLLMVIAITLLLGKGFVQVFIAVGLTMWVEVARIVRGQLMAMRGLPYVESARAMGYSSPRIIFRHLLPNAMGPVIVVSTANFASAILIEAGLSFLGIGTRIPMPSWGGMIKEHYAYITTDMAYLAILPGLAISLLVLALMLIGNRLRDILDVRA